MLKSLVSSLVKLFRRRQAYTQCRAYRDMSTKYNVCVRPANHVGSHVTADGQFF